MSKPLLDLSTLEPERPVIRIDGTDYELAVPDDFGLREQARLARLQKLVAGLNQDTLDDAEIERARVALDETLSLIVRDLPADVRARLSDAKKLRIIQAFTRAAGVEVPVPPPQSTSAS